MTTYARPGTFVTENFGPLTAGGPGIPGEALPAFCGIFNRGPTVPTLISSWNQFVKLYGDFTQEPGNYLPFAVYQFFSNGGNSCFVLRLANTDATAATLQLVDIASPTPDDVVVVNAQSTGVWGETIYVEVAYAGQTGRVNLNVYLNGTSPSQRVETFQDASVNPTESRNLFSMVSSPISGSAYITLVPNPAFTEANYVAGTTDLALIGPTPLASGNDGTIAPVVSTVAPPLFDTLINQALYVNFPTLDDTVDIDALNSWAVGRQDTMIVIDGPAPDFPETEADVRGNYLSLAAALPPSTYLVIYAPWLLVVDPSSSISGATRYLPPGGAMLAMWQQADTLWGTVQTPAGVDFTVKCVDLEARFSNASLDALNLGFVDPVKYIPGIGFAVFGGRTLHPGYPDRYVAVRRMIIKLEHDLKWLTQYAIFQPNDAILWKSITVTIQNYLLQLMQAGQLGGDTPADSFSVICDDTINTPATSAAGIVNCNVAVSLLSPAEFIEIQLSQFQQSGVQATTTTGVSS